MGVPCRNGETFSWVLQKVPLWLQRPWQGRSCACSQAPVTASPPHATPEGNASCDFIFFQFLPRNYLCATGAQQPDSVAAAWLAQASRAHREDEGDEAPRDRQGGQQGLSSSGSFCLFNILQTSSAGKAPAHSLEARLLLQRWLWILNYTGLDVKHYIGGNKVMRALLMSLKIPLWRDVKSGLCMEIKVKLIPSIH